MRMETGVCVLHLFCSPTDSVDRDGIWRAIEAAQGDGCQVVTAAILGHKGDLAVMALGAVPAMAQNVGPSTMVSPYVLPSRPGVSTTSILTVNDPASTIGGYRMVGRPDGLGALAGPGGRFTLLMNHELVGTSGAVRAGGFTGAFVSRWELDPATLRVASGRDHNTAPTDVTWYSQPPRPHYNLCSGDLAAPGAYTGVVAGSSL